MVHALQALLSAARGLLGLACLPLAGCQLLRSPAVPMPSVFDAEPSGAKDRVLLVLFPGTGDTPDDLRAEGMVAAVRAAGVAADVLLVDAHLGYYRDRQLAERVWTDAITPTWARHRYRGLWFAGLSLGGLGALVAASDTEREPAVPVDGLLLLAPYVVGGTRLRLVEAAGGLASFTPPRPATAPEDRLLAWLHGFAVADTRRPRLYVACGDDDRLLRHTRLLAGVLPADAVVSVQGGHSWQAWRQAWPLLLARAPLPRVPSSP